jgi:soluble lytic murein transglycosylase-like protein
MIKLTNIIIVLMPLLLGSCLTIREAPKDPCLAEDFLKDIDNYSRSELLKLVRILESSSSGNHKSSACKDALLGKIYFSLERMSLASDYFSDAAKKMPDLAQYFLLAKAHAEFKRNNYNQAQAIANALLESSKTLSPQFALKTRKILADIALKEKDNQQIIKTHQAMLNNGYSANEALLFNLATALANAGAHEKANEIYKRLLTQFPTSPGAERALQLKNLAKYNLELKDIEKRFDKLIEKLAFDRVVSDTDFLLEASPSFDEKQKSEVAAIAVKSLMFNNRFADGIKRSRARAEKKTATARDLESYAFALGKAGYFIEAADFYGRMAKISTNKDDQAKACFFKGFSLYEASLYSMALFAWQSCKDSVKGTDLHENYAWYQSLAFMLQNNYQKSIEILNQIKQQFPKSSETDKYNYFIGYNLQQINKTSDSKASLLKLAQKSEPGYYAQLARQSLKLSNPKGVKLAADALSKLAKLSHHHDSKNALFMFHIGFKEEARDVVLRSSMPHHDKLALLQHMGFYNDAYTRAGIKAPTIVQGKLKALDTTRAQFPVPHQSIMDAMSKKYGINKNLLMAIMKTESSFANEAVSPRGARGLMQMMPFVASDLAAHLSIDQFNNDHLSDPKVAIELGALLIATLKRQFNHHHLVAASYNAGSHQVQKWINLFGHLPTELFIERIPFKQTRDYVKKVLQGESLYHAMNGNDVRLLL